MACSAMQPRAAMPNCMPEIPQVADSHSNSPRGQQYVQLHQLRHFLLIAEYANFSRAAEMLGKSQQALSKSIQSLEESLGVSLFDRSLRTVSLTEFGQLLLPCARSIDAEISTFCDALSRLRTSRRLYVRLGASAATTQYLVPEAILRLMGKRKDLQIAVLGGAYPTMLRELLAGQLDLFVCIDIGEVDPPGVVRETLAHAEYRVIAAASHPLAHTRNVLPEKLCQYGWILGQRLGEVESAWRRGFEDEGIVAPEPVLETTSTEFSKSALQSSDYLTVLPVSHVEVELERHELCCIDAPRFRWSRPLALYYRRHALPNVALHAVISALRSAAKKFEYLEAIA